MEEVAAIQKESKEKSKTYSSSLPCKVPSNFPSQMELVNVITQPIKLDHSGLFWWKREYQKSLLKILSNCII